MDALTINQAMSSDFAQLQKQAKTDDSKQTFLGHVLATLLEEMVPKEGQLADPNSQLFFSMYFAELMEDPEMINAMGLGEELYA